MIPDTPTTISLLPFFTSGRFAKAECVGRCRGGQVSFISGRELVESVRDLSLGLSALGLARTERVALIAESRPEWLVADFAILALGAVTTPIYPTLSIEQVSFILRDSEASLAIVSTAEQLTKVLSVAGTLPQLRAVVVMDPPDGPLPGAGVRVASYADVAAMGHKRLIDGWGVGRAFHDEARKVQPGDLATIIYTSGTTGEPKGVCLTHANLVANLQDLQQVLSVSHEDTALSFLPLCHAFERMVAYLYLTTGVSVVFAESLESINRDLQAVRPTVMTGVPRVFEKLQERIMARGRQRTGLERRVFEWAVRLADTRGRLLADGRPFSWWLRLQSRFADARVFRVVRDGLGGRMRFVVSGSAPLRPDIGRFFHGLGLPILEGYGLTETAPVLTVMPLDAIRFGTVGKALPSVELRIADDGEILARGPNVTAGYHRRPEDTAAALEGGWFHTGDLGSIDADGYLRITGRKKELIVTSGGKKIAPQPIEAALRRHDLVSEAVLIGDERKYPAALLVPDFAELCRVLSVPLPADAPAAHALLARPDVRALFQQLIDALNVHLAQFERIKKFALLPREFSMASGELTPTLKVKRRVVETRYRDLIQAMYE